jgi:hypothetical protein
MKYEGSTGFVSGKMNLHVLGLFMTKTAKENFRLSRAVVRQNLCHAYRLFLKS